MEYVSRREEQDARFTGFCLAVQTLVIEAFAADPIPGVKSEMNIPYVEGGHARQMLDLYLPEEASDKPLPLVIWIHGGAWFAGSRARPPIMYLVHKGFAVASIDYRFSQDAIWPAQINDCKAAVRFSAQRDQVQSRS